MKQKQALMGSVHTGIPQQWQRKTHSILDLPLPNIVAEFQDLIFPMEKVTNKSTLIDVFQVLNDGVYEVFFNEHLISSAVASTFLCITNRFQTTSTETIRWHEFILYTVMKYVPRQLLSSPNGYNSTFHYSSYPVTQFWAWPRSWLRSSWWPTAETDTSDCQVQTEESRQGASSEMSRTLLLSMSGLEDSWLNQLWANVDNRPWLWNLISHFLLVT